MTAIHSISLSVWRSAAVSIAVEEIRAAFQVQRPTSQAVSQDPSEYIVCVRLASSIELYAAVSTIVSPTRPSPSLISALCSLTQSAEQLGLSKADLKRFAVLPDALHNFITAALPLIEISELQSDVSSAQVLCDLTFLRAICQEIGVEVGVLEKTLSKVHSVVCFNEYLLKSMTSDFS